MTFLLPPSRRLDATARWSLPANATRAIEPRGARLRLQAVRGTWLVTQAGDAADHVLGAGDALVVAGRGRVVAWALTDAELAIAPEARARAAPEAPALAATARR